MKEYPRILHAVESIELGKWPLVDALHAEVETNERGARDGEIARVVQFLAAQGYGEHSASYFQDLFSLARWLDSSARDGEFRAYPVSLVRAARKAAASDHEKALRILGEKTSFRQIEGRPSERRPKSALEKLSRAAFAAWEVQEHLMDDTVELVGEERVLMLSLAEKIQRLGQIIVQQIEGGSTEIDLGKFFDELEEFRAAH